MKRGPGFLRHPLPLETVKCARRLSLALTALLVLCVALARWLLILLGASSREGFPMFVLMVAVFLCISTWSGGLWVVQMRRRDGETGLTFAFDCFMATLINVLSIGLVLQWVPGSLTLEASSVLGYALGPAGLFAVTWAIFTRRHERGLLRALTTLLAGRDGRP